MKQENKSSYTEWRHKLWKMSWSSLKGLNKRQDRVKHRLAFKIRRAIMESYGEYNDQK